MSNEIKYPAILTNHDEGMEIYFPDLKLTGFPDDLAEAEEILKGYIEILHEDGEQLPPATRIDDIKLKPGQKVILVRFNRT